MFHVPENNRIKNGRLKSSFEDGNNGAFSIDIYGIKAYIIASDGLGWEHVSITLKDKNRTPSWSEMCFVKNIFWDKDDIVLQIHPPEYSYVNNHPYCLHLWRNKNIDFELPPSFLVGIQKLNHEECKKLLGII